MKHSERKMVLVAGLVCAAHLAAIAEIKVERSPLEVGGYVDVGQVVKGATDATGNSPDGQMKVLQHTAVYLNQTTTVNDRLDVKVGVGGLFFYGYPETDAASSRGIQFGPGVGQAQGIYKLGNLDAPSWVLQFGFFPYKYNPDAKNLGEYLLRSGAYPGYEVTGGWSNVNSALYMASGLRLRGNFLSNTLHADLNLFLERDVEPQHDLSPSIVISYKPVPLLEVGAGAEFAHLLPVYPSKLKSKATYGYVGDSLYKYTEVVGGIAANQDIVSDTVNYDSAARAAAATDLARLQALNANMKFFTFQGVKLMGRVAVNLGSVINNPWIGEEGLKLYAEAAVLGVKDYPYFYDDIMKRIPVMVGVNLPTLKFFDVIAFEYEYRKWNFENNIGSIIQDGPSQPIWSAGQDPEHNYDPNHPSSSTKAQDNKWSFYAKKQLMPGVSLYAQVASDYLRGIGYQLHFFSEQTITSRPSQWYYLFRLEFGI